MNRVNRVNERRVNAQCIAGSKCCLEAIVVGNAWCCESTVLGLVSLRRRHQSGAPRHQAYWNSPNETIKICNGLQQLHKDKEPMNYDEACNSFASLLETITALRDPETGCPWDLEQTHLSLRAFAIEEAYELVEAIESGEDLDIRSELGDVLLQVLLHAQIASDRSAFSIKEVIKAVNEKMIRRHPHIFGAAKAENAAEVLKNWEEIKRLEDTASANEPSTVSEEMKRKAPSLPGLERAVKIGKLAADRNFDWPDIAGVLAKVREELTELESAVTVAFESPQPSDAEKSHIEEELGDLLFSLAQLARKTEISPEVAAAGACNKFIRRFSHVEKEFSSGCDSPTLSDLEAAWQRAKNAE